MKYHGFVKIISVLLCVCLLASCHTETEERPKESQSATSGQTETGTESGTETGSTAEQKISFTSGISFSGQKRPAVVTDKRYLSETAVDRAQKGKVVYSVNDANAGYVRGTTVQDAGGETRSVKAIANVGYKFVKWSDGVTEPKRAGDSAEGVYTAIFDYDVLDMPIVVMHTRNGKPITSKTEYTDATISILGCEQQYELQDVAMELRGRGNYSWEEYEKKSYKLKLAEKENLFDLGNGKERIWVLLANHGDQSLLRNHVALEYSRYFQGIAWGPASTSVEVYLNGEYVGVYLLAEEIKVSGDRVAVDDSNIDAVDTGYLLELSNYADGETIEVANRRYEIHNDLSSDRQIKRQQKQFIEDYIKDCYDALAMGDKEEFCELVDVDSFVAAYLVEETVKNLDAQWDSFYLYKDAGGKLCFGPVWDFDLSLGNADEGAEEYTDFFVATGQGSGNSRRAWFALAMRQEWFRQMVVDKWTEVYDSISQMPQFILDEGKLGFDSYKRNFKRWKIFGTVQNRETHYITSLETYEEHYQYLAQWLTNRIEWLNDALTNEKFVSEGLNAI